MIKDNVPHAAKLVRKTYAMNESLVDAASTLLDMLKV
jgi:hypothetical protein